MVESARVSKVSVNPFKVLKDIDRASQDARRSADEVQALNNDARKAIAEARSLTETARRAADEARQAAEEVRKLRDEVHNAEKSKQIADTPADKSKIETLEKNITTLRKTIDQFRGLNRSAFREDAAYRSYAGKKLINIGAGHFYHQKWTNLDVSSEHYESHRKGAYVEYNIISDERIPLDDASVAVAYTSHTIEHIKNEYVYRMFREVYRCLEPGGIFRITCPNADLFYTAVLLDNTDRFFHRTLAWFDRHGVPHGTAEPLDYLKMAVATGLTDRPLVRDENRALWEQMKAKFTELPKEAFLDWLCGHVDFSIKNIARHINWWTIDKVSAALQDAGFNLVRSSVYGGSLAAPMCDTTKFDNTMPDESLYVEAYKF
ncbi:methyltransferase domain-containing protein [Sinorhizobium meliloti]|uniref:class I SAM-dependent methyltransferase n=1 Tax=Rhizobium meliloti TaxID=382 RepID=UPI00299D5F80|nr:methyltransferase domain-containing protein [Sinorhizobium meliloti]MDW9870891.1 methyltransferase domain-containing protein [Sinorhizobium meliloti]MDW9883872.1 methyltransferase domain-containing protein [Sinorhizobium meliloti]MDX0205752.1 methyltransferase domain-containing protein [Sinorhizobium meliloti]